MAVDGDDDDSARLPEDGDNKTGDKDKVKEDINDDNDADNAISINRPISPASRRQRNNELAFPERFRDAFVAELKTWLGQAYKASDMEDVWVGENDGGGEDGENGGGDAKQETNGSKCSE